MFGGASDSAVRGNNLAGTSDEALGVVYSPGEVVPGIAIVGSDVTTREPARTLEQSTDPEDFANRRRSAVQGARPHP